MSQQSGRQRGNGALYLVGAALLASLSLNAYLYLKRRQVLNATGSSSGGSTSKNGVWLYNPGSTTSGAFQNFDSANRAIAAKSWMVASYSQVFTAQNSGLTSCTPGFASDGKKYAISGSTACTTPASVSSPKTIADVSQLPSAGIYCYGPIPDDKTGIITFVKY